MKTRVLEKGAGKETRFHTDDDSFVIETVQDVQPILEQNKKLLNSSPNRKANMRHVASVPNVVNEEWKKEFKRKTGLNPDWSPEPWLKFVTAKLNDPDNGFLRTWKGKL